MCYNGNSRKVNINLFKGSNRVTHITKDAIDFKDLCGQF